MSKQHKNSSPRAMRAAMLVAAAAALAAGAPAHAQDKPVNLKKVTETR